MGCAARSSTYDTAFHCIDSCAILRPIKAIQVELRGEEPRLELMQKFEVRSEAQLKRFADVQVKLAQRCPRSELLVGIYILYLLL